MVSTKYHTHRHRCVIHSLGMHTVSIEREALDCSIREECAEMTDYS